MRTVSCPFEPTSLAVSNKYLAAAFGSQVTVMTVEQSGTSGTWSREFGGNVDVLICDGTCVLACADGRVSIVSLSMQGSKLLASPEKVFPENIAQSRKIAAVDMYNNIVILGHEDGKVCNYFINVVPGVNGNSSIKMGAVSECRIPSAIVKVKLDPTGSYCVVLTVSGECYLMDVITAACVRVKSGVPSGAALLWDFQDVNVFSITSDSVLTAYAYSNEGISDADKIFSSELTGFITELGTSRLNSNLMPRLMHSGVLRLQSTSGELSAGTLSIYESIAAWQDAVSNKALGPGSESMITQCYDSYVKLGRLRLACDVLMSGSSFLTDMSDRWSSLGNEALRRCDIQLAIAAYRNAHDVRMAHTISLFAHIEDRQLLMGHIYLVLGNANNAVECVLRSSTYA